MRTLHDGTRWNNTRHIGKLGKKEKAKKMENVQCDCHARFHRFNVKKYDRLHRTLVRSRSNKRDLIRHVINYAVSIDGVRRCEVGSHGWDLLIC